MLYLQYYGLRETPFQDTANPIFFWFGKGQSEAVAILTFGIEKGESITVLTGDVGIGKTTLAKYLADHLKSKFNTVRIDDSELESLDFLYFLADSLNLPFNFEDKRSFFQYVDEEYSNNQKPMLIILDEAHRLTKSLINDLFLMAKIKRNNKPLINILLVGQKPIIKLAKKIKANGKMQKDCLVCHLRPLTKNETADYIKYRLSIAGPKSDLFTSNAIGKIYRYSEGIPRMINTICDQALMIGYSKELKKINGFIIKETVEDLNIYSEDCQHSNGFHYSKKQSGRKIFKQVYQNSKQKIFAWIP